MKKGAKRRALVVLGMHRSGTSATGRVLSLLGAELPRRLMPAAEDNPTGFWESRELLRLHEELLDALGSSWHDPLPLPASALVSPAADSFRQRIVEVLAAEFGESRLFVVKDPRICRLMPLWKDALAALDVDPCFVLTIRNPLESAASLAARDGFSTDLSLLLWLWHVLSAERESRGAARSIIDYDELLTDWRQVAEKLSADLEITWPRSANSAAGEIEAFLSTEHRHHVHPAGSPWPGGEVADLARRAYDVLGGSALDGKRARGALAEVWQSLQSAEKLYAPALEQVRARVSLEDRRTKELERELEERTRWAQTLDAQLREKAEAVTGLQGELEERSRWAQELDEELREKAAALAKLQDELEARNRWGKNLEGQAEKHDGRIIELQKEIEERNRWAKQLDHENEQRAGRIAELEGEVEKKREAEREVKARLEDREARLVRLEARLERVGSLIHQLRGKNEALEASRSQLEQAHRLLEDSRARVEALLDRVSSAERDGRQLGARLDWQGESLVRHQSVIEGYDSRIAELESHLRELSQALDRAGQERGEDAERWAAQLSETGNRLDGVANQTRQLFESRPWRLYSRVVLGARAATRGLRDAGPTRWRRYRERRRARSGRIKERRDARAERIHRLARLMEALDTPHREPIASVVVRQDADFDHLLDRLFSLAEVGAHTPFEIVTVATDRAAHKLLRAIPGLTSLWSDDTGPEPINRAARHARGRHLVFLGLDTLPIEGWLDCLLETFEAIPECGLAGVRVLDHDRRLLEAGAKVTQDGDLTVLADDSEALHFTYAVPVDSCAHDVVAIPCELFSRLGGFDNGFATRRWQTIDLGLRARAVGRFVYLQGAAEVERLAAADGDQSDPAMFARDRERFKRLWARQLYLPAATTHARPEQPWRGSKLLVVDHRLPTPDQDSGSLRMDNLLRVLSSGGFEITFLPANLFAMEPYGRRLRSRGIEVIVQPHVNSVDQYLQSHGDAFDFVIVSRIATAAQRMESVRRFCPRAKVMFDTVDLHFLRLERQAELAGDDALRAHARKARAEELALAHRADATLVVSPVERDLLAEVAPDIHVHVLSNIHEIHGLQAPLAGRRGLLFIGGFEHPPNADAAIWMVESILPLIHRKIPDANLVLVGSKPTPEIERLASPSVTVTGHVEDVEPYFSRCRLSVAPLRYGAGVKGKVNQSLAYGVPCVLTTCAAEGMDLRHEVDSLIADDPAEFAECVVRAYQDDRLWERLSKGGLDNVRRHFSFDSARASLESLFESLRDDETEREADSAKVLRLPERGA